MIRPPRRADDPGSFQLSTRFTLVHKVVLPIAWAGFFGVGTVVLLVQQSPDRQRVLAFVVALVLGAFIFWNWGIPLKRVIATDAGLRVSNFRREALVPYAQIAALQESKIVNTITVHLSAPSAWGTRFAFRPYTARGALGPHPAVLFLGERVDEVRRGR